MDAVPGPVLTQTPVPLPHRLPGTEAFGQITPGNPCPVTENDPFDHLAVIPERVTHMPVRRRHQRRDPRPLGITEHRSTRHGSSLARTPFTYWETRPSAVLAGGLAKGVHAVATPTAAWVAWQGARAARCVRRRLPAGPRVPWAPGWALPVRASSGTRTAHRRPPVGWLIVLRAYRSARIPDSETTFAGGPEPTPHGRHAGSRAAPRSSPPRPRAERCPDTGRTRAGHSRSRGRSGASHSDLPGRPGAR